MSVRSCENASPAHRPSGAWSASNRAPQPSVATRARSAAMTSAGSWVRSRITCQRIAGSASSNQSMTSCCRGRPGSLSDASLGHGSLVAARCPKPTTSEGVSGVVRRTPWCSPWRSPQPPDPHRRPRSPRPTPRCSASGSRVPRRTAARRSGSPTVPPRRWSVRPSRPPSQPTPTAPGPNCAHISSGTIAVCSSTRVVDFLPGRRRGEPRARRRRRGWSPRRRPRSRAAGSVARRTRSRRRRCLRTGSDRRPGSRR